MKNSLLKILVFLFVSVHCMAQDNTDLIPYPEKLDKGTGHFTFPQEMQLVTRGANELGSEIAYLRSLLSSGYGIGLSDTGSAVIELGLSPDIAGEEAYSLEVTPRQIRISASHPAGVFYGIQSLHQLMSLNQVNPDQPRIPVLNVADRPAFPWRGSMLDVSRHFYTTDYLKRHIDRLAFYKMNKFHIHLTDDQGWRIEIKKYPELTGKSAFRTFNNHDSVCMALAMENPDFEIDPRFIVERDGKMLYGGYYTQEQLRDLVSYASERHVEIIPEIDMPGHMMAAIAVYPELIDGKAGWGELFSTPICPCKEDVYTFVENVIREVASVFPSPYIHIGADEVDKTSWETSELCKQLMEREGIKSVNELQSYFVHRVQEIVAVKGKKIIVWDEALEGGLNADADVMYWRGWVPGSPKKAALNNNRIIMAPTNPLYFDTYPDKSSLRNIYCMDVVYDDIPESKVSLVQGAQANLWAEKIPSEGRADFLLFPRLTALSDRLWTNDKGLFDSYSRRLLSHYPLLDKMEIAYRLPDLCGFAMESVFLKESGQQAGNKEAVVFEVKSPLADKTIHYTVDGSIPTKNSPVLKGAPFVITRPETIKFALFSSGNAKSKGDIYTVNYKESAYAEAVESAPELKNGLTCDFYRQAIDQAAKISGNPDQQFIVKNITVPKEAKAPQFGLKYTGYVEVPETGIYSFYLTCDDGGMLYIADRLVIDNEGPHSPLEKSGQAALEKGLHPFRLDFVEGGGGFTLLLQYSTDGCEVKDIPDSWFKYESE